MSHLPSDFAGGHGDVLYYFGVVSSEPGFFDFGGQSVCNVGESSNLSLFFVTHVFPDVSSSDDLARIELSAGCTAGGEFGGPGTCLSSIDPMVDFAPGFDHTGLSLVFSPNPPGSAVPEPGSFALLGFAIAMLFYVARGRRD